MVRYESFKCSLTTLLSVLSSEFNPWLTEHKMWNRLDCAHVAYTDSIDVWLMASEGLSAHSFSDVPELGRSIAGSRDKHPGVRCQRQAHHITCVTSKRGRLLTSLNVPQSTVKETITPFLFTYLLYTTFKWQHTTSSVTIVTISRNWSIHYELVVKSWSTHQHSSGPVGQDVLTFLHIVFWIITLLMGINKNCADYIDHFRLSTSCFIPYRNFSIQGCLCGLHFQHTLMFQKIH